MNQNLAQYLRSKRIDTFQKLNFLLFLHQYPHLKGTSEEFAARLYFGDIVMLKKIIFDLQFAGLVQRVGNRYMLRNDPLTKSYMNILAGTFKDPITRQELLNHVQEQVQ